MLAAFLMALGLVLIILEVCVIPGVGLAGVSGVLSMIISVVYAYKVYTLNMAMFTLGTGIAAGLALWYWAMHIFPKTKASKALILDNKLDNESVAFPDHEELLGCSGRTTTVLRPGGKATIDGEIYDVVASGGTFIEKNTNIIVKKVSAGQITVDPVAEEKEKA